CCKKRPGIQSGAERYSTRPTWHSSGRSSADPFVLPTKSSPPRPFHSIPIFARRSAETEQFPPAITFASGAQAAGWRPPSKSPPIAECLFHPWRSGEREEPGRFEARPRKGCFSARRGATPPEGKG